MFIRVGGFVGFIAIVVWLYAIFDALTAPAERIRGLPKAIWLIIVILLLDVGALAWFVWGRPRARAVGAPVRQRPSPFGWQSHDGPSTRGRTIAPDDDPDFLKRLGDDLRRDRPDDDNPAP
jgi:hypothetical protein